MRWLWDFDSNLGTREKSRYESTQGGYVDLTVFVTLYLLIAKCTMLREVQTYGI